MFEWSEVTNPKKAHRLERARAQPALCFLGIDLSGLLQELLAGQFVGVTCDVRVSFVSGGPLVCILIRDAGPAHIYIHQVLNHPETPPEVIRYVLQHELLHLQFPAEGDQPHPSAFREAEKRLCPEMPAAWMWMRTNLWQFIRNDCSRQRVKVTRNWRDIWRRNGRPLAFDWNDQETALQPATLEPYALMSAGRDTSQREDCS